MRLNWFSPLPPARTGIADYTARVLPALRAQAEVILWTDQKEWDARLEHVAEVRRYKLEQMPWVELNRGDMSVYHIGNDPAFHGGIWEVSCLHPGIMVLHDLCLQGLFAGLYRDRRNDRDGYIEAMERCYGALARQDAEAFWDGRLTIDFLSAHYPLTSMAVENGLGVVVHSQTGMPDLMQETPCPVTYTPLPYLASPNATQSDQTSISVRADGPPYRLILFGHIHINRRLDSLLQALAGLPEKDRFRLQIYGRLWDEDHVRRQMSCLGVADLVDVRGFVSEDELEMALNAAHLAVNLRYPTMGEASISQLQIWNHALPTLVTRVGWYEHLPESAVAFVRPEHEISDIRAHLQAFLADPAYYATMGASGRRLLETDHTPELYAQAIAALAAEAAHWRPYAALRAMHRRVSVELGTWMTSSGFQGAMGPFGRDVWGSNPEMAAQRRFRRLDRQHMSTFRLVQEATVHQVDRMRLECDAALQAIRQGVADEIGRWERWRTESTGDL